MTATDRYIIRVFSKQLFKAIKHGKKRHRNWLERKMKKFTKNFTRKSVWSILNGTTGS